MTKKITLFGDSLLRGITLNADNTRYSISKQINWSQIENDLNIELNNQSRMGATITYGHEKLTSYLESDYSCDVIVIEYGGNDSDYNWQQVSQVRSRSHQANTSPKLFKSTLIKMINLIQSHKIKVILVNLPAIDSNKYYSWITRTGLNQNNIMYFLNDVNTIYRHHEIYSSIISEIANKMNIELVDIRSKFLLAKNYSNLISIDGIHATNLGIDTIVNCFITKYKSVK